MIHRKPKSKSEVYLWEWVNIGLSSICKSDWRSLLELGHADKIKSGPPPWPPIDEICTTAFQGDSPLPRLSSANKVPRFIQSFQKQTWSPRHESAADEVSKLKNVGYVTYGEGTGIWCWLPFLFANCNENTASFISHGRISSWNSIKMAGGRVNALKKKRHKKKQTPQASWTLLLTQEIKAISEI